MSFEQAFSETMRREGGYVLHRVAGDTGGTTYAGIARNANPGWPGWAFVDRGEMPPTELVRVLYHDRYWAPIKGDDLPDAIAASIFDFGVNAGVSVAVKLAQVVAGVEPDGQCGPKTVEALNAMSANAFIPAYALAKVKRYADICNRNRSQSKFLLGWINRTMGALT